MDNYIKHDPSTLSRAQIGKVFDTYAVAYPTEAVGDLTVNDSVTFSLDDWQGSVEPQTSQIVILVHTMLYARGWRAREAYPITPRTSAKGEVK